MSLPFLVYCSLLKRAQYKDLRDLANVHHGVVDITRVDQAMRDGIERRLELAEQFLLFSERLSLESSGEIANRNAVSRAYYAAHHAVRALLMFEERGDVDGHREAIKASSALLKRNRAAESKSGNPDKFRDDFEELLNRRHLADYYPYGANAPNEAPLDFAQAAPEAIQFARRVVENTRDYIKLKESSNALSHYKNTDR